MKRFFAVLIGLGFLLIGTGSAHAINYSYSYLDIPGQAVDMNDKGTIVGSFQTHGFIFKDSSWVVIDPPNIAPGWQNHVTAVNNEDTVVGWYLAGYVEDFYGYSYNNGNWAGMGWSDDQYFYDINDAGIIVGFERNGFSYDGTDPTHIIIYSPDEPYTLHPYHINNQGVIVGMGGPPNISGWYSVKGSTWKSLDYPGATSTTVWDLNNLGTIVGQYTDSAGKIHGFIFDGITWKSGNYPGAIETIAYDINDKGLIVGSYVDADGKRHGFSYINGVWSSLDYPGATETYARLTNNNGLIVGSFTKDGQEGQFSAIPIITVEIDIRPKNTLNQINYRDYGTVPVAILSSRTFKAYDMIDAGSITFGHTGDEASLANCDSRPSDVNRDGYGDLVCYFSIPKTGFQCGNTVATLKGKTKDGKPINGRSYVRIIGCR